MSQRTVLAFVLVLAFAASIFAKTHAADADQSWLIGDTWWYAHSDGQILEGEDKDGMVFKSNGNVDLVNEVGKAYLTCSYTDRVPGQIRITCIVRGELRRLGFIINADKTHLAGIEDTDHGFYTR